MSTQVFSKCISCAMQLSKLKNIVRSCSAVHRSNFKDTIYALSSGQGKCGVAVVRVSGSMSKTMLLKMAQLESLPKPRKALLKTIVEPQARDVIDSGEDCIEFQIHGGLAVVSSLLKTLSQFPNTRPAQPGEFTKRAFLNTKLDLTKVEGLADVIHAETEAQRKQAIRLMSGDLHTLYSSWRQLVLKCLAHVEAYIDFSEEENIEADIMHQVETTLFNFKQQLVNHLIDGRRGKRLRNGVQIAILGKPNVGKSSLMNYLARKSVAIVSPIEGTTRDVLETSLDIDGYPVVLLDTAGLRRTKDVIEKEGVRRAVSRSQEADLVLLMLDVTDLSAHTDEVTEDITSHVELVLSDFIHKIDDSTDQSFLVIVNKTDLVPDSSEHLTKHFDKSIHISIPTIKQDIPVVFISVLDNRGLSSMFSVLSSLVREICGNPSAENPSFTQARHRDHVTKALGHVTEALECIMHEDVVITAEYLRLCASEIGKLIGVISSDDVLDVIFRDFCIGK